jgi:hypothetical protein
MDFLKLKDSTISKIEVLECDSCVFSIYPEFEGREKRLMFVYPVMCEGDSNYMGNAFFMTVNLDLFHGQIAQSNSFSYAYLTLSHDNSYVFHPDENKIGMEVEEQNRFFDSKDTVGKVFETFSDYLQIPVYRYFDTTMILGSPWVFTANVPGISFKEIVNDTRNSFVAISLLAAVAFVVIFFMGMVHWLKVVLKNEYQKQQVLEKELEQLKSGLNPHFLFNSLSSLKILVSKKPEEAKSFAVALSDLYRYLLKQEKMDVVPLEEELRFANNYIYLQQIRFPNIDCKVDIPADVLERGIPPMSLQLLVENCIKHTKVSSRNPLHIEIMLDGNFLVVRNNFNPPEKSDSPGIGLTNLTKRYSYLTNIPCEFYLDQDNFVAKIPLL